MAAREGSLRSAKILLLNFANRNAADNMDQSPIQIARERGHHDIVELISDWTLGANSPPKVPGPTSPESQKSPHNHHGHPTPPRSTTSPPNMIRPKMNNIAPKMSHIPRSHAHAPHNQTGSQGCPPAMTDKCLNDNARRASNKRKRKSCNKAAQHPVRAKINGYDMNVTGNSYAPNISMARSLGAAPTLSPPRAEVPPNRLAKGPAERPSGHFNRGSLPELSEKDIIEGLSLFATHGCLEDFPSNWDNEETPLNPQSHHQSVPNLSGDESLYLSTTLPNSSIGLNDVTMHIDSSEGRPKFHREAEQISGSHYGQMMSNAENNRHMDPLNQSHDMHIRVSNDFDYYRETQFQRQLHADGMGLLPQFPTPPSTHSSFHVSSPGKSISPQDSGAAGSLLTPSPDSPKRSPGGWSTSPQSSESSVC